MRWSQHFRPAGVAFGVLIVLNVALALDRPELAVTSIWLDIGLPEPALSLLSGVLAAALFVPHAAAARRALRIALAFAFAAFLSLNLESAAAFYQGWWQGSFSTAVPVPLSLVLAAILAAELARVLWWSPRLSAAPAPAWLFVRTALVSLAFAGLMAVHIVSFGHRDHRRPADAAVIFGAKVYADGTPCAALVDRMETGIDLFAKGLVGRLILTGAVDANGRSEPRTMRDYVVRRGVPASRVLLDERGVNTWASAVNVARLRAAHGLDRVLAVSQYFHCARIGLIFGRQGVPCSTVPTPSSAFTWPNSPVRLSREWFFLAREAVAFPFYMLYYR